MTTFGPLRVTAVLATGQVATYDGHLPLDGILAAAWFRKHRPDRFFDTNVGPLRADELITPDLPVARCGEGDLWYWACSYVQADWAGELEQHFHKKFDVQHASAFADEGVRKVFTGSGPYRPNRTRAVIMLADRLVWYCLGDEEGVRELVNEIASVGKFIAQGYGQVAGWTVEPWPADWSVRAPDGRLMRAVPDPEGERVRGFRPPYWHPANQTRVQLP